MWNYIECNLQYISLLNKSGRSILCAIKLYTYNKNVAYRNYKFKYCTSILFISQHRHQRYLVFVSYKIRVIFIKVHYLIMLW